MISGRLSSSQYDVAIVGTGPAGISLALKLAERGARILLIESGGRQRDEAVHAAAQVDTTGDLDTRYFWIHTQREFGGTSIIWTGVCSQLETRAFDNGEWPIPFDEVHPYYEEAADILELPAGAWSRPNSPLVEGGAVLYRPYYLSPPVRFGEKYYDLLSDSPNVDIQLDAACTGIQHEVGRVTALVLQDTSGGPETRREVQAKHFVLACGGIGNPRLLQLSQIGVDAPVGETFMEHPHIYGAGELELDKSLLDPRLEQDRVFHALQLSDAFCLEHGLLNFTVQFFVDRVEDRVFLGGTRPVYVSEALVRAEMVPYKENRTYLGDGTDPLGQPKSRVDFHFNHLDLARRTWAAFGRELLAAGIGRATTPLNADRGVTGGGHFMGSTRMGTDPRDSVVDEQCRVHGLDNLFIAGSSIFPAAGAANPTFSIVAFSLRLADHLSERLREENES